MEDFSSSASDGQNILVFLTKRCVWKGVVCEKPHFYRIKYYQSFNKPLEQFLLDDLFDQDYRCGVCEMPSEAHIRCYTNNQGSLTISVRKLTELPLPEEKEGKIWMWHRCLQCPHVNGFPPATSKVAMSDAARGLSFGKFLELSFSNHAVASCGHSLHRDCLRFYGCGRMVACFHYAPIIVNSVYLPPSKLEFPWDGLEWIQKEADEVTYRAEILYTEVVNAINKILDKWSRSGPLDSCMKTCGLGKYILGLERILKKEKDEFKELLQKALQSDRKGGIDILEINRLRRHLLFQSFLWDQRLIHISTLDEKISQCDSLMVKAMEEILKDAQNIDITAGGELVKESGDCGSIGTNLSQGICIKSSDHLSSCSGEENTGQKTKSPADGEGVSHGDNMSEAGRGNSSSTVQRAALAGPPPNMRNLSDVLEAAWIGENHTAIVNHKENDATESSTIVKSGAVNPSLVKYTDGRDDGEIHSAYSVALPTKSSNFVDNSTNWLKIPFLNLYQSIGKNMSSSAQKLDAIRDYNPVFISSFCELERQGGARLLLPVGFNDTVIPIYDDEPTSIIAYALISSGYQSQISEDPIMRRDGIEFSIPLPVDADFGSTRSFGSSKESFLSMSGALHARVSFSDDGPLGIVKYTVTCYYAKRFEALRKISCPSEMDYIRSLSRCKKWGAHGGNGNVFFATTLDERLIIKQITKTELESFMKFAPAYFAYISESMHSRGPTCLAKILGIYQVTSKHLKGGRESKMDVLVMENLLFRRNVVRLYDLKGSCRSQLNRGSSGGKNVLLDQDLIETMPTSPIFLGSKANRSFKRAVWNDSSFLASIDVMDYSLLVGIDEERQELVVGIIDFMKQYTWYKHLETWVKDCRILCGSKNASPPVVSPMQYKKRFRKAIETYFTTMPDQSSPLAIFPDEPLSDRNEENSETVTSP